MLKENLSVSALMLKKFAPKHKEIFGALRDKKPEVVIALPPVKKTTKKAVDDTIDKILEREDHAVVNQIIDAEIIDDHPSEAEFDESSNVKTIELTPANAETEEKAVTSPVNAVEVKDLLEKKVKEVAENPTKATAASSPDSASSGAPSAYDANNDQFGKLIPRLDRLTKLAHRAGFEVMYSNSDKYPGLITASIEDCEDGHVLRTLGVDNCVFYGDTLRVVTMDNNKGDIRRETFVPISQEEAVTAMIGGQLTTDMRKAINLPLSKYITDYRYHYGFLDRVDMSGLTTVTENGNTVLGVPFDDWKQLVNNIGAAVFHENIPVARFRIDNYVSPDTFMLVADENVRYPFSSEIKDLETNKNAMIAHTNIVCDHGSYTANNVVCYNK